MARDRQQCLLLLVILSSLLVDVSLAAPSSKTTVGNDNTATGRRSRLAEEVVQILTKRWNLEMGGCHCSGMSYECWSHEVCKGRHGPQSTCKKVCCGTKCAR